MSLCPPPRTAVSTERDVCYSESLHRHVIVTPSPWLTRGFAPGVLRCVGLVGCLTTCVTESSFAAPSRVSGTWGQAAAERPRSGSLTAELAAPKLSGWPVPGPAGRPD